MIKNGISEEPEQTPHGLDEAYAKLAEKMKDNPKKWS